MVSIANTLVCLSNTTVRISTRSAGRGGLQEEGGRPSGHGAGPRGGVACRVFDCVFGQSGTSTNLIRGGSGKREWVGVVVEVFRPLGRFEFIRIYFKINDISKFRGAFWDRL